MRAILFVVGLVAGSIGAAYAFPVVAPRLSWGLGESDLLPLAPIRGGAPAAPSAEEGEPVRFVLEKATGKVERLTLDGEWTAFATNEAVADGEQLRTDADSTAAMSDGRGAAVTLAEVSHLAIRRATAGNLRVRLLGGLVTLSSGSAHFAVESRSGKTVVEGQGATSVLADGDRLWVACKGGSTTIASAGERRDVPAGNTSSLRDGAAPGGVRSDKAAMDLKVLPVESTTPGARSATVAGTVTGGGRVIVAGAAATVDERGAFEAKVKLHPGANNVVVVAQSVDGTVKRLTLPPIEVAAAAKAAATPKRTKPRGEGVQWGAP